MVALDVTSPASITLAIESVMAKYGAIDAVVNNAGIQIRGYFEETSDAEFRRVFDTNFFGALTVTRAVLPHMRAQRRGRVVLMTSVGGRIGSLGLSAYCASKFALEGLGETLALELSLHGIDVSMIEPGIVNTRIWNSNLLVAQGTHNPSNPNRAFFAESEKMAEWAVKSSPVTEEHVAKAVHHAVTAARPKRRYLVGYRPAAFLLLRRLLPTELFERLYGQIATAKLKRLAQ